MEGDLDVDIVDIVSVASHWQARAGDAQYDLCYNRATGSAVYGARETGSGQGWISSEQQPRLT